MYKARHVANSLLLRAREKNIPGMSPLKVQKLLYFLNGWYLVQTSKPLIGDRFQAWAYGPVVESLYHELKTWGSDAVNGFISEFDPETRAEKSYKISSSDLIFWRLLDRVLEKYGKFSALELSTLSHEDGSPWSQAKKLGQQYIDDNALRNHFSNLASSGLANVL
jgi:uncharacterized phage-associated protein